MEALKPSNYKKYTPTVIIDLAKGKVPPQSVDLEEAVLGALLVDSKCIDECLMVIQSSDIFYKEANKVIFEAISDLYSNSEPIDLVTVGARLRSLNTINIAGGDYNLLLLFTDFRTIGIPSIGFPSIGFPMIGF